MLPTQENLSAVMEIAARPDLMFMSGRGSWLKDQNGKTYLDFIQGWAVNSLGHCSSVITGALILQASRLINCSPAFFNAPMVELAKVLADASGLEKVFFANSGAEANEGAIKLARKWGARHRGGAYEIVTMDHGFHGRTLACMAASGKAAWENLFEPKVPGFRKVPLNDLDAVARVLSPNTVAVMLEPIQGEAGVYPPTLHYLRALRKLTEDAGVLLILDEVQTGVGRTGRMFDFENAEILPDIMTLGKGLGGGVPLAALLARDTVACFDPGDQGGTFNGNPLTTAVGLAVVQEILKPDFLESVAAHGRYLTGKLEALSCEHGLGAVRGRGLLLALDTGDLDAPFIVERARIAGLLLNAPRSHVLRFMPALNVTLEEIDHMVSILGGVLRSGGA